MSYEAKMQKNPKEKANVALTMEEIPRFYSKLPVCSGPEYCTPCPLNKVVPAHISTKASVLRTIPAINIVMKTSIAASKNFFPQKSSHDSILLF